MKVIINLYETLENTSVPNHYQFAAQVSKYVVDVVHGWSLFLVNFPSFWLFQTWSLVHLLLHPSSLLGLTWPRKNLHHDPRDCQFPSGAHGCVRLTNATLDGPKARFVV